MSSSASSLSADDLGCWMKACKGDVPPPLVGASITFYQPSQAHPGPSRVFLFGGRLVTDRKMMNHLYVLDTQTLVWKMLIENGEGDGMGPSPRYFHSMEVWRDNLVLFAGMGYPTALDPFSPDPPPPLEGLADLYFFHIPSSRWRAPALTKHWDLTPRYAHISAVTANKLVIVGGQDIKAVYVQEVSVFDLEREEWVASQGMGGGKSEERGMYRSACVAGERGVGGWDGGEEREKGEIMLYSNYNFTDVRRVLEILHPDGQSPSVETFSLSDRSSDMRGYGPKGSSPQGLRFPSGARLGDWLLFGGIYLASSVQEYCLWALDLTTREWKPVEMGKASCLQKGSWNRGLLDPLKSLYMIFGSNDSQMLEDYNKRATNYSHIVTIDLESFGVYRQPKSRPSDPRSRIAFSEFEDEVTTDFDIICEDGRRLRCSRRMLEERWPWFARKRQEYTAAVSASSSHSSPEASDFPRPSNSTQNLPRSRVRNAQMHLQEPYPVVLAFLQYIYTLALDTPVQNAPPVLSSLLVMSQQYQLAHLQRLVVHRMHQALSVESAEGIAEVASICGCESLMIRAWRMLGSGNATETDGALAAVRMSRGGGSGSGGGSGLGRNGSYDSGFGSETRGSGSGRGSAGVGGKSYAAGSGVPSYSYSKSPTSPTDVGPTGLPPISGSTRSPITRRGSEPPRHLAQPSTASSTLSSASEASNGPAPRQRTISAGSSLSGSPSGTPIASPGPGFLKGRDRSYSLGRSALALSPLSTSSTPPAGGLQQELPSSIRPISTSTTDTAATDSLRSPDLYPSESSHGPVTPNESESFPFPGPSEKTPTFQASEAMQSQLSVSSRDRSDSTTSSGSVPLLGATAGTLAVEPLLQWPRWSPNSLALPPASGGIPTLAVPSPSSESGRSVATSTSASTVEQPPPPNRRGSFAISSMFSKKKQRPSQLERTSDDSATSQAGPTSPALPSPGAGSVFKKASPPKKKSSAPPTREPISSAFGWKSSSTIDKIPAAHLSPPAPSLPPPALPKPSAAFAAVDVAVSRQQTYSGPLSPGSPLSPTELAYEVMVPPQVGSTSKQAEPRSSTTTDTTFSSETRSQHPSTAPSSLPNSSTNSNGSDSLRVASSSRTTSVPIKPPKIPTPSLSPSSAASARSGSTNDKGNTSFLSGLSLTPNKHAHSSDSRSQTTSVSSGGSGSANGKSSGGGREKPTVFVHGRGGAGKMREVKPSKTEAERVREKELRKEGKKKVDAFWA